MKARFQVREAGAGYEWLPRWCVIDTERQVRVAAYSDEATARADCAGRNDDRGKEQ